MTPDELKTHCLIRICDDDEDLAAALELFLKAKAGASLPTRIP